MYEMVFYLRYCAYGMLYIYILFIEPASTDLYPYCHTLALLVALPISMNAPLRINEALVIADRAVRPVQCVAWAPQDGNGELSLTVIDRTNTDWKSKRLNSSQ